MSRVIITGGNGFIGRPVVKKLLSSKQYSVVLISNTSNMRDKYLQDRKSLGDMPIAFYTADIRDKKTLSDIFIQERADTCIHLAAKIGDAESIKNPVETMDINVEGTLNVLEACFNSQVNNFVFTSSAAVYRNVRELPIRENSELQPLSPYGTSKMIAEQQVSSYSKLKIQNAVTLRIFNVYGDGQVGEADVISKFAAKLSKGLPPIIYGDGMQTRDYIAVDDVADGILLSIRLMEDRYDKRDNHLSSPMVFNIGTGKPTSVNELAQKMTELFGLDLQPTYEEEREDNRAIFHSYADVTKAKELLHFVPKKAIDTGLREIIRPMLLRK